MATFWSLVFRATRAFARLRHPDGASGRLAWAKARPPRPITPAAERAEILAALAAVDYVVEFDEPSPSALIAASLPRSWSKATAADSSAVRFAEDRRG